MIKIALNGAAREVPEHLSLVDLLDLLELTDQPLLVEHNGIALLKTEWTQIVQENDHIELVRIVAGG